VKTDEVSRVHLYNGGSGRVLLYNNIRYSLILCENIRHFHIFIKFIMVKITKEEAINRFKEYGFKICGEYKSTNTIVKCQDEDGYYYDLKLSNLKHNKSHQFVGDKNPYTIENIKTYLKNNNINTELLSDTYISCEKPLLFKCECGNNFTMSWNVLKQNHNNHKHKCIKCMRNNAKKKDFNIVKSDFAKLGLTILDDKYKNNSEQILCRTSDGYRIYIRYATIQRILKGNNKITHIFSITDNYDNVIYNLQNYCNINHINVKPIRILDKEKGKHKRRDIEFQCQCGNHFVTTIPTFMHNKRVLCDKCNKRTSSYEKLVIDFLDYYNIDYIFQKTYDDCRDTLPLPFDFYIINKNMIIEIDGEGHSQIAYFNNMSYEKAVETYNMTQKHDKIKNEYCKNKGIKLIRIPYWDILNDKYKDIIYENVIKE